MHKLFLNILLIIAGTLFAMIILLTGDKIIDVFHKTGQHGVYYGNYESSFFESDTLLGYKPKASMQISSIKKFGERVVYDVQYSIDHCHRRVTPLTHREQRKKFILFFGCSFAFGEGVNDTETFPYFIAQKSPGFMPYNYGYVGYGPQQTLAKLQDAGIRKEIEENQGILIYLFMGDHFNRAIGSMVTSGVWGYAAPYYFIDERNQLVRQGSFESGRPLATKFYKFLMKTNYGEIIRDRGDFPRKIDDDHIMLTARILEEACAHYRKKFNNSKFYIVFYPGNYPAERLIHYLKGTGIQFLDYHKRNELLDEKYRIAFDGHPNAEAYKELASMVVDDVPLLEKKIR